MDGWWLTPIPGCLRSDLLWLSGGFLFLRNINVAISLSPHVCLILDFLAVPRRYVCLVSSKLLFLFFFFIFFLARFIGVVSVVSICLVCDSSIVVICPLTPAARFAFCLFYTFCFCFS